jgi:transposase
MYREEFLRHYHKRSNVETAVMMIKSKFGDAVRSKTEVAMRNEVLCKQVLSLAGMAFDTRFRSDAFLDGPTRPVSGLRPIFL